MKQNPKWLREYAEEDLGCEFTDLDESSIVYLANSPSFQWFAFKKNLMNLFTIKL